MTQTTLFDKTPLTYHTKHLKQPEREALTINAASQEQRIVEFLANHPTQSFGASAIWTRVGKSLEPITSIRRALTNLTKSGRLRKLDATETGAFGKQEHLYQIEVAG